MNANDLKFGTYLRYLAVAVFITSCQSQQNRVEQKPAGPDELNAAESLIHDRQFKDAKQILSSVIHRMPNGWRASMDNGSEIVHAYWSMQEFLQCSPTDTRDSHKAILWKGPSYSKAYFLMAYIQQEEGDIWDARDNLDRALVLEPDSPEILLELGNILLKVNSEEAIAAFDKASKRTCYGNHMISHAYSGKGVALIDLGRLDEAEQILKKSLELEQENTRAVHELQYIGWLRRGDPKLPLGAVNGLSGSGPQH